MVVVGSKFDLGGGSGVTVMYWSVLPIGIRMDNQRTVLQFQ